VGHCFCAKSFHPPVNVSLHTAIIGSEEDLY